jgi:hypothetical protein
MPVLTRRQTIARALAALLAGRPREAGAAAPPGFGELAAAKGILYGRETTVERPQGKPTYRIAKRKNGTYAVEVTARVSDPPTAFGSFETEAEAKKWIDEHTGKQDASPKS